MRIAFDTTPLALSGGGVATYAREILDRLLREPGLEVVPVAHARTRDAQGLRRALAGVDREARWHPRGLAHAARAARADLIHTPAAMPVRGGGLPVVMSFHDAIPWRHPEWFTRANALQQRLLVGRTARHAARVITASIASRDDLVSEVGIAADRIDVIADGISEAFSPTRGDRVTLDARYGTTGPVILSVGTPEPRKNLATALRAYARVLEDVPAATLLLVGGHGWRNEDLERRIEGTPGRVIRTGYVPLDDLPMLYASADCLLFPSLMEGFGFPPLEAMASGLPVVCSDRPSLPEVVGDAALTAPPLDAEALARHVIAVLTDPDLADDLRTRGLAQAAPFTWDRTAAETFAIYRRVLEG
jgi:alpha-1,3-rhamnosyl/mannosyltransferase